MTVMYNEIDSYAADWMRNLSEAGHIAHGVVDERSIEDIPSHELARFTQCHFFAGIGVWSYALRAAGWPDDRPIWSGSCPCQPFSAAGQGLGFADERHLWPTWLDLIAQHLPPVIVGEQVASKDAEPWLDLVQDDLEGLGYAFGAVAFPSASVGAPHIRDRTYWVAIHPDRWLLVPHRHAQGVAHTDGARLSVRQRDAVVGAGRREEGGAAEQRGGAPVVGLGHTDNHGSGRHAGSLPGSQGSAERGLRGVADGAEPAGDVGGLADSTGCGRCEGCGSFGLCFGTGYGPADDSQLGRLEHPGQHHDAGQEPAACDRQPQADRPADQSGGSSGAPLGLADTNSGQFDGLSVLGGDERFWKDSGWPEKCSQFEPRSHILERPGPTNGFWASADWLACRDGRWRPVEPGSFPLADGLTNRVGRLRAYGNAINAEAAKAWIEVVMEILEGMV